MLRDCLKSCLIFRIILSHQQCLYEINNNWTAHTCSNKNMPWRVVANVYSRDKIGSTWMWIYRHSNDVLRITLNGLVGLALERRDRCWRWINGFKRAKWDWDEFQVFEAFQLACLCFGTLDQSLASYTMIYSRQKMRCYLFDKPNNDALLRWC